MADISEINKLLKNIQSIDSGITDAFKASQISQYHLPDLKEKLASMSVATVGLGLKSELLRSQDNLTRLTENLYRSWDIPEQKGVSASVAAAAAGLGFTSELLRSQESLMRSTEGLYKSWGIPELKGLTANAKAAGLGFMNDSELLSSKKRLASLSQGFHAMSELRLIKSSGILEAFKQRESLLSAWNTDDLIKLRNLPDSFVYSNEDTEWVEEIASYTPEELQGLYDDTAEAISKNSNFQSLALFSQKLVLYILSALFAGLVSFIVADYLNHVLGAKAVLVDKSLNELKAIALGKPVKNIDRSVLRGLRFVHSDGLKLRYDPMMQSEIITILPRGTLLTVLDKTQRSWIQVSVELNGEEEIGWVGRRYTSYFK